MVLVGMRMLVLAPMEVVKRARLLQLQRSNRISTVSKVICFASQV